MPLYARRADFDTGINMGYNDYIKLKETIMDNRIKSANKSRVLYLDLLKVVAAIGVVAIHVSAENWRKIDIYSADWAIQTIYDGIMRCAVPIFIMVSGALFLGRDIPIKTLYKKYVLRLLIVFCIWSFTYAMIMYFPINAANYKKFILELIKGHYHLWFIPMIAVQYMLVPITKKIARDKKIANYFIIMAIIFASIVPTAIGQITAFSEKLGETLDTVYTKTGIGLVLGYTVYFMLGYVLNKAKISRKAEAIIYTLGAIGFIITPLLLIVLSRAVGEANSLYGSYLAPNVMASAVAVFVFTKKHSGYLKNGTLFARVITTLSLISFGVYLVHPLFLDRLQYNYKITPVTFGAAIGVPVLIVIIYGASTIVSLILNKIPIIKKYIV